LKTLLLIIRRSEVW